jgi:ABC-type transporter Mla MlaB component
MRAPRDTDAVHDGAGGDVGGRVGPEALDVRLEVADGAARLRLAGPFIARTAGRVKGALELVSVASARVVVDLTGVTRIDDAALDLLASARRTARREGWELALAGARGGGGPAQPAAGRPSRTMVTKRTSNPARS